MLAAAEAQAGRLEPWVEQVRKRPCSHDKAPRRLPCVFSACLVFSQAAPFAGAVRCEQAEVELLPASELPPPGLVAEEHRWGGAAEPFGVIARKGVFCVLQQRPFSSLKAPPVPATRSPRGFSFSSVENAACDDSCRRRYNKCLRSLLALPSVRFLTDSVRGEENKRAWAPGCCAGGLLSCRLHSPCSNYIPTPMVMAPITSQTVVGSRLLQGSSRSTGCRTAWWSGSSGRTS